MVSLGRWRHEERRAERPEGMSTCQEEEEPTPAATCFQSMNHLRPGEPRFILAAVITHQPPHSQQISPRLVSAFPICSGSSWRKPCQCFSLLRQRPGRRREAGYKKKKKKEGERVTNGSQKNAKHVKNRRKTIEELIPEATGMEDDQQRAAIAHGE